MSFFLTLCLLTAVRAEVPAWLKAVSVAASVPTPEADAVKLLDERITTVRDSTEISTVYRQVYRVLKEEGKHYGRFVAYFDDETRITALQAWHIPVKGAVAEAKEKDAMETAVTSSALYSDTRYKVLSLAAEIGSIVAFEYEQRRRPNILDDVWQLNESVPVRLARFALRLPPGWEFSASWLNHAAVEPRGQGSRQVIWELTDLPAIVREHWMPSPRAVAARLGISYFPPDGKSAKKGHASWRDVGRWYNDLASDRRRSTDEIRRTVSELFSGDADFEHKVNALAAFVQRGIRYVAIEIGIGSHRPHAAGEIFKNRFGDCKDKATLLAAMLTDAGIDSFYTLVHSDRGVVAREFPTRASFNHVILAIRLPPDFEVPAAWAAVQTTRSGRMLFFDPTDPYTALGQIPTSLQGGFGLVVTPEGGELEQLPVSPPSASRLARAAELVLSEIGDLAGTVREEYSGHLAAEYRARFAATPEADRATIVEDFLSRSLTAFSLKRALIGNLPALNRAFAMEYRFEARAYAKSAGILMMVRPRVLGQKGTVFASTERHSPIELPAPCDQEDTFAIQLPAEFGVDEVPEPVDIDTEFASYRSKVEVSAGKLSYHRRYQIKKLAVGSERFADVKAFFDRINRDERESVVLRRR